MKTNQKSVRLSDEAMKIIEEYSGASFNDKLENFVVYMGGHRADLVETWTILQSQINDKRDEYRNLVRQVNKLREIDRRAEPFVAALVDLLKQG